MSDAPMSNEEGRALRDAMKELTAEFRAYRTESAQTFVRQDTHSRDLALLTQSQAKDVQLLTQALTTLSDTVNKGLEALGGETGRVTKLENDSDWLRKIIYGAIILAILASIGLGSAASAGVFNK